MKKKAKKDEKIKFFTHLAEKDPSYANVLASIMRNWLFIMIYRFIPQIKDFNIEIWNLVIFLESSFNT